MTTDVLLKPFGAAILILGLIHGAALASPEIGEVPDFGDQVDRVLSNRSEGSEQMERWFALYAAGKTAEADRAWASALKAFEKREEIGDYLEFVNQRCWFSGEKGSPGVDPEKTYGYLLVTTERILGKEHRFVADICTFLATYAEARKDFKAARALRLRDLRLHEKALGKDNRQVLEAHQEIGHLLMGTKEYREAEKHLLSAIENPHCPKSTFQKAVLDYIKLLRATGRDVEARRVSARYRTYMWNSVPGVKP
ncbi:MAG: hypothetical protein AB7W16_06085 [Candidatus Obscuribacterales bacterium]